MDLKYISNKMSHEICDNPELRIQNTSIDLGPVYTIPFSNENGTKSCRFGLPFTLKRFRNRHQMKTILKTARFENDMKRFSVNA